MSQNFYDVIEKQLKESAAVKMDAIGACGADIVHAVKTLVESYKGGGKLLLCGNGGSAADCQHMAAEFVSVLTMDYLRPGLPAIALTTDTSFLTANANDFGFEGVFERQVQTLGKAGDVLIGITTSGSSKNVLRAFHSARSLGIRTIMLMGNKPGASKDTADVVICVPHASTQRIQETFLTIEHIICDLVEHELFGTSNREKR